ncbi:uncharacterized protein N7484_006743 [Penicillium longicatenatum]|uniref:uncharacterized protein n=1 Tax=Penicillium longicatenatum TaxID=1561947 RepID=UPI002547A77C|nr:uncharacterized protein N7484_006743 [Penicillium longicatenatum]KAJ5644236.1 hypothetical protein N7484_006743 [Penicillium longicatenatum]
MAPILRLDTCLYRLFQKSNLLIHEDPSGKNVLSAGIEGGTAALTANQGKKLNDVLSQIINLCNENISEVANQYDAVWSERENWIEYARSQKINGVDQASENIKKFTHEVLPDAPGDAPLGDPMTSSIPQSNGEYDENNHSIKDEMDDSIGIPPSTGDQSLKYDKDNRSIEDEWFKHHDALRIKGDAKETIILFEKIFKYKGGSKSHYGVQRRIGAGAQNDHNSGDSKSR